MPTGPLTPTTPMAPPARPTFTRTAAPPAGPAPAVPATGGSPAGALPPIASPPPAASLPPPTGSHLQAVSDAPQKSTLQKIGGTLGRIGGVALSAFAPNVAAFIPSTPLGKIAAQNRELRQEGERARISQEGAQTDLAKAEAGKATADQARIERGTPEEQTFTALTGEGKPPEEALETVKGAGKAETKEANPEARTYDALLKEGKNPLEAYDLVKNVAKPDKTQKPETLVMGRRTFQWDQDKQNWKDIGPAKEKEQGDNEGSWQFAEDADGKPILYNTKTAQTRPAPGGAAPKGTKAKADLAASKTIEPIRAAVDYAETYLNAGAFTGSGDEALQEKFFELAKPTTGFRMTQPQMDMLRKSRGWMGSAEAFLRHAATGVWFSNEQRQEIVSTMKDLAAAKEAAVSSGGKETPTTATAKKGGGEGKTLSMAAVEQAAKDNNISVDAAKKQAQDAGYKIE